MQLCFQEGQTEAEARACPDCPQHGRQGRLGLKLASSGGFIGCSSYPDCRHTRPLELVTAPDEEQEEVKEAFPSLSEGGVTGPQD